MVFTSFSDRERIVQALDAGAIGYLLKDAEPEEIHAAIRAAARGDAPLAPRAAAELLAERRERVPAAAIDLTAREREVLALVVEGLANKQIARRLGISEKTVKGHLTNLFQRIGVADRTQAALWAERNGILRGPEVPGTEVPLRPRRPPPPWMACIDEPRSCSPSRCRLILGVAWPAAARGVEKRGHCSGGSGDWRLSVRREDAGRLRVRFEIEDVPAGQAWQVFLSDNGSADLLRYPPNRCRRRGARDGVSGNRAGTDHIAASARERGDGRELRGVGHLLTPRVPGRLSRCDRDHAAANLFLGGRIDRPDSRGGMPDVQQDRAGGHGRRPSR